MAALDFWWETFGAYSTETCVDQPSLLEVDVSNNLTRMGLFILGELTQDGTVQTRI
jgi:hypothetical protein